jgi:hypothetical protein
VRDGWWREERGEAGDRMEKEELRRWLSSGVQRRVVWWKFTNVSEVLAASIIWTIIALMMEAARTSETMVNFYQTTRRYNPEDSHLRTHSVTT